MYLGVAFEDDKKNCVYCQFSWQTHETQTDLDIPDTKKSNKNNKINNKKLITANTDGNRKEEIHA